MQIIDDKTVVVTTSNDLKEALSLDNGYLYIYFGNDINLESGFVINANKEKVIIDGTYLNNKYTYTNYLTDENDVITASSTNKKIIVKNLTIKSSHTKGIVSTPDDISYSNTKIIYSNIKFNGIELSYNQYGITSILDSNITIENTNNVNAQRVCDCNQIEIGGQTLIDTPNTAFIYLHTIDVAEFTILENSRVNVTTLNAFFNGTPRLNFKLLHNSIFNLTTSNGFAQTLNNGCLNVLIDEYSTFNFIENNHQRIPMWNIYGNLEVNEGASFLVINSYKDTPSDNYNIYFKGTNQNFILNNPKNVSIYTKNANVLRTENPVNFSFTFNRLNMWKDSIELLLAGTIEDLPDYSWYKENELSHITGVFNKTSTVINETNYTDIEKANLPDLSNFVFQGRKEFSVGMIKVNIHALDNKSVKISGHTLKNADVLISYDGNSEAVTSSADGLFEYTLTDTIPDGTDIEITVCQPTSFIYNTRKITTPFNGEITLFNKNEVITFNNTPISNTPMILAKLKPNSLTVVDSRKNSSDWNLYINYLNPMKSKTNKLLSDSLLFKKNDSEIVAVKTISILIYHGTNNGGVVNVEDITYSVEEGLLLGLNDPSFIIDEEYITKCIWSIELL